MKIKLAVCFAMFTIAFYAQKQGIVPLQNSTILHWEIQDFDNEKHSFKYCTKNSTTNLCEIDDQSWFGGDIGTDFPQNYLSSLAIEIDNKKIKLDTSQMYNPNFSGALYKQQFKLKKTKDYYILYGYFSDGAGSYTAHWKIRNQLSERILISTNEDDFQWQLD